MSNKICLAIKDFISWAKIGISKTPYWNQQDSHIGTSKTTIMIKLIAKVCRPTY